VEVSGGAMCLQRVCPYGKSFSAIKTSRAEIVRPIGWVPLLSGSRTTTDANALQAYLVNGFQLPFDLNVEIEITSFTDGDADGDGTGTYKFKRDVDRYWSAPVAFDTATAVGANTVGMMGPETAHELVFLVNNVQKRSGVFIYIDNTYSTSTDPIVVGDKWFLNVTQNDGSDFAIGEDALSHQVIECSGAGMCNRQTGLCECFPGYGGDHCGRTACPNDCSGHGVCQSLGRFAADTGVVTYSAFDNDMQYGCKCDPGFRGPDCAMVECPSGPDPMNPAAANSGGMDCSGRGNCDYASGQCKCAKGFFGERCESITTLV
jgi:EGF-like domain/Laminin EGF domain